jgi:adenylate kinase
MDLVMFGRQGSGKGTQGKYFAERYGFSPFVMGDELRKLAKEDSDLGKKVKEIIEAGHLVSTDVIMEIIANFMDNLKEGTKIIFDGLPRKLDQAEQFDALMEEHGREFKGCVITITEETAIRRLTKRRMCSECKNIFPEDYDKDACEKCGGSLESREDDSNMDSIRNRLDAFNNETTPVIERYRELGKMIELDGEPKIDVVNEEAFPKLDAIFKI